jgi:hypothetical protein
MIFQIREYDLQITLYELGTQRCEEVRLTKRAGAAKMVSAGVIQRQMISVYDNES